MKEVYYGKYVLSQPIMIYVISLWTAGITSELLFWNTQAEQKINYEFETQVVFVKNLRSFESQQSQELNYFSMLFYRL